MEKISELQAILNGTFQWNKARMECFINMLIALLISRTVNLSKIAAVILGGKTTKASCYRRVQRFFAKFTIDFDMIAGFIFRLMFVSGGTWHLTMDRTNWRWGETSINVLVLAIALKGIAIPIYWELLDKKGNSNTKQRINLLEKFINKFGQGCIAGFLADREFIGKDWFNWLSKNNILFCIRIKNNFKTTNSRGGPILVKSLFYSLKPMELRVLYDKRNIMGCQVYVEAMRLFNGELLIVATNEFPASPIKYV